MFLEIFSNLLKSHNLNKRQFSIKSGIPYTTIDGFYKKGYENMRLSTLQKIADYFNVSLDYLMFGSKKSSNNKQTVLYETLFNKLNDFGKQKVIDYIKDLSENPKYTQLTSSVSDDISNDIAKLMNMPMSTKKG